MIRVRTFEDVPDARLKQLVGDLQKEVDKEAIHVTSQPDGKWKVAVVVEDKPKFSSAEQIPPLSGSYGSIKY